MLGTIMCAAILGVVITFAKRADAGLFSSLWSVLGNEQASAQTKPSPSDALNSQKYPLPSYPSNSNVLAYAQISSTTPPIADGVTLSPDIAAANDVSGTEPVNTRISVYVVRDNDTISGVAKLFNVSVNTLLWANNLTSKSILKSGQTLIILPVTGITYAVKKGDTIQGIAKKYNADITDILNYNDLTLSSSLGVGDEIIIPDAELAAPAVTAKKPALSAGDEPLIPGSGGPSYAGYYSCPVRGSHVSQGLHGHNGVDLASPRGTAIHAAAAGTVIINRANGAYNGGYGNFVVILHGNGTQTLYAHMSQSTVKAGDQVTSGEVVGYIGMTGLTTGPHVHFEIRGAANPFGNPANCK